MVLVRWLLLSKQTDIYLEAGCVVTALVDRLGLEELHLQHKLCSLRIIRLQAKLTHSLIRPLIQSVIPSDINTPSFLDSRPYAT